MNSLLISWNFDLVSGSDGSGQFTAPDTSNSYTGAGINYIPSDASFVAKEDFITNIKTNIESLESSDSIQILEEDDQRISYLHKPSSTKIMLENSMYQIISDEMLNLFSTIDAYSFKFMEYSNKYSSEYKKLSEARHEFFSKILEKPNLEKYIEFYKWIDSSLGYMLDQLIPENSNSGNSLKNIVESHALERNKYKHQLPLTIDSRRNYSAGIEVIKSSTTKNSFFSTSKTGSSNPIKSTSGSIEDIVTVENTANKNYTKNYQFIHTSGKKINNRGDKLNKTVFKTVFSNTDENSGLFKDESGEYSVYNDLNQRSLGIRKEFNVSESLATPYATQNIIDGKLYGNQGSVGTGSFRDNNFVFRNVPYTASNYHNIPNISYQNIPSEQINFRRYGNLLIDVNKNSYEDSKDIVEPPIQFNIPLKHRTLVNTGLEYIDVYSPYSTRVDQFSYRNLIKHDNLLQNSLVGGYYPIPTNITFFEKTINNTKYFKFDKIEKADIIFPRTDLIGLAEIRTKATYEEEYGVAQSQSLETLNLLESDPRKISVWSDNSYNNGSVRIRSFWKDEIEDRKRARGIDNTYNLAGTGSINCYGFPNLSESQSQEEFFYHSRNPYNSVYSMDCNVDYQFIDTNTLSETDHPSPILSCSNEIYGDLAPYSHFNLFYLANIYQGSYFGESIKTPPKPSFIFNNFIDLTYKYDTGSLEFYYALNKSYQNGLDCRIRPWYNNYEEFRENIKHKSQNYSIVPEFIVSKFENVITNQYVELYRKQNKVRTTIGTEATITTQQYLTINGQERYDQIRDEDFKVDLKKFIDKKTNKIKFNLSAVKKLLPYNGFYPQQRTAQIAGIFHEDILTNTGYINNLEKYSLDLRGLESTGRLYPDQLPIVKTLCTTQPLFMPGILFNTVKAGIAMPWNICIPNINDSDESGAYSNDLFATSSSEFITGSNGQYSLRQISYKLPFETILNPVEEYNKVYANSAYYAEIDALQENDWDGPLLAYLDPTHQSNQINLKDGAGLVSYLYDTTPRYTKKILLKNFLQSQIGYKPVLYKSSINNFLSETVNFFMNDGRLNYFASTNTGSVSVVSGTYSMRIVLDKNPSFSMFNSYKTDENVYVHSASLFGPPVTSGEVYATNHSQSDPYYPYAPTYFYNAKDYITITYDSNESGSYSVDQLVKNIVNKANVSIPFKTSSVNVLNRVNLKDCVNYSLVSGSSWIIQTKYEMPLLDFNLCSYVSGGVAHATSIPTTESYY